MRKLILSLFLFISFFKTQAQEISKEIIPNQGFSITTLWRGILGMLVLLLIAYLF